VKLSGTEPPSAGSRALLTGATYVFWTLERLRHPNEDYPLPILRYTSYPKVALSIAPEDKNNSTARVSTGYEPPLKFIESELVGIDSVEVDYQEVWFRPRPQLADIITR